MVTGARGAMARDIATDSRIAIHAETVASSEAKHGVDIPKY
jgi:hypothetical protein